MSVAPNRRYLIPAEDISYIKYYQVFRKNPTPRRKIDAIGCIFSQAVGHGPDCDTALDTIACCKKWQAISINYRLSPN